MITKYCIEIYNDGDWFLKYFNDNDRYQRIYPVMQWSKNSLYKKHQVIYETNPIQTPGTVKPLERFYHET